MPAGRDGTRVPAGMDGTHVPAGRDGSRVPAGRDGSRVPAGRDGYHPCWIQLILDPMRLKMMSLISNISDVGSNEAGSDICDIGSSEIESDVTILDPALLDPISVISDPLELNQISLILDTTRLDPLSMILDSTRDPVSLPPWTNPGNQTAGLLPSPHSSSPLTLAPGPRMASPCIESYRKHSCGCRRGFHSPWFPV